MTSVFNVFPFNPPANQIAKCEGSYLITKNGKKILDVTAGDTSYAIVGWQHPDINEAMVKQLKKFSHIDYKAWLDPNVEILANLLLQNAPDGITKVYFSGNSGAEACEASMRMSYQAHYDMGKPGKKWFISREQSYHGATADALALGERPNLEFFRETLSPFRSRIPMHHPKYLSFDGESEDDYAKRSANELEQEILRLGPENVSGFVAETILGGLVGDVPPAKNYWKYVRQVCDKYDVHLILDEVYCGTGTTGKTFACEWDEVTPDFIFIGKTLAAGYGAISAVLTTDKVFDSISSGQHRLQHTTTHQAHSLGVAAAIEVQKIVQSSKILNNTDKIGSWMREALVSELSDHEFFYDVRGRGLRLSFEYKT